MNRIRNYDIRSALNCDSAQLISYLKHSGLQVELLFYNALENTSKIRNEILICKRNKWVYETDFITDNALRNIGIGYVHRITTERFDPVAEKVLCALDQGFVVMFLGNGPDIPHWVYTDYNLGQLHHSVLLDGYVEVVGGVRFSMQDNESPFFKNYEYPYAIIEKSFDNGPTRTVITYELDPQFDLNRSASNIRLKHQEFIRDHQDAFLLYDHINDMLAAITSSTVQESGDLVRIAHALSIVSGTRYFYSQFLCCFDYPSQLAERYAKLSENVQLLVFQLYKCKITREWEADKLIEACRMAKDMEIQALSLIKKYHT